MSKRPQSGIVQPFVTYTLLGLAQRGAWLIMLPVYFLVLQPDEFALLVLILFTANVLAIAANLRLDAAMRTFYFDFDSDSG
ncbi:MAG: hypothetical protein ACR2QT_02485, partial [Woeseiaceae bacterium]